MPDFQSLNFRRTAAWSIRFAVRYGDPENRKRVAFGPIAATAAAGIALLLAPYCVSDGERRNDGAGPTSGLASSQVLMPARQRRMSP